MTNLNKEEFQNYYQLGKKAFECGKYRISLENFEKAIPLINDSSRLGGEVKMWLVNAYLVNDKLEEAIALCEKLIKHPHPLIRQQSKDLLYIIKAPQLKRPKEWMSEIPDLNNASENSPQYTINKSKTKIKEPPQIQMVDLSQVNTKDNQFIWLSLGITLLIIMSFLIID